MDRTSFTSDDTITPLSSKLHFLSSLNVFPDDTLSAQVLSTYARHDLLGEGSYGKVYKDFLQDSKGNRVEVAVKKVRKRDETEREVEALRMLQGHLNIVKLYKVEDAGKYKLIFQELCQGTLEDAVKRQDLGLPEIEVLLQITSAIVYIHRQGFVHKDLKAENILVQRSNGTAIYKLADFGLCRKLDRGDQYSMCTSGNKAHKPPEVLLEQERQRMRTESFDDDPEDEEENTVSGTAKVDIFGLGCIFYYVLTKGKHPFEKKGKYDYNILNNKYSLKDIEHDIEAHHLIQKMISHVPSERPPATAVLGHPFFFSSTSVRADALRLPNVWHDFSALCKVFPESRLLCNDSWLTRFDEADLTLLKLNRRDYEEDSITVRSLARGFAQGLRSTAFEECLQLFQKNVPGCFLDLWMIIIGIDGYHYTTVRSELQKAVELNKELAVADLAQDEDINFQSQDGKTALHLAVQTSTDKVINLLLDHGARWDIADEIGWTPLHYAVRRNLHTVELLFDKCQDLADTHKKGWTPLHIASSLGLEDTVRYLLDQCTALATAKDSRGLTALHIAVNPAVVKELFELLTTEVEALDYQNNTPLHLACTRNLRDVALCLIEKNASINAINRFNATPLHVAVQSGATECALLMLENEADISKRDVNGASPLVLAATNNNTFLVKELIARKADVNMADILGDTPLHRAAFYNHAQVANLLVKTGCLVVARNILGSTPLHSAAEKDALESAAVLVKYKHLPNSTDSSKHTPLHSAAYFNAEKVARLLLSRRAKISAKDAYGGTPLHYAALNNSFSIANLLTKEDAPLLKDNYGLSALHIAAQRNSVDVASLLLNKFGDVNDQTADKAGTGYTPLHVAASTDAVGVAKVLLDKGASADQKSRSGITPLHATLSEDAVNVASLLLENGADVNAVHSDLGKTALHVAAELDGKAQKVIRLLLQCPNINLSIKCREGRTPLLEAAYRNAEITARLLLEAGAEVNEVEDKSGYTALHIASVRKFVSMAKLLIEYKADVNARCRAGNTPLNVAAAENAVDILQVLVNSKADVNAICYVNKSGVTEVERTSLHMAALCNSKDAAQFLLDNGANVNAKTGKGITPLIRAILSNSVDVFSVILDAYTDVTEATEKNVHEENGYTPLHVAAETNRSQIVELLVQKGVCVNARSLKRRTALYAAVAGKAKESVQLLLKHGADINASCDTGETPLHVAAKLNTVDIVELLVQFGVDLNQSSRGATALHYAANFNSLDTAKYLLKHNVNPSAADDLGLTPLHYAVKRQSIDVFHLLLNHECVVDCIDANGQTPLYYAVLFGLEDYAKFLLVTGANPDIQDNEGVSPRSLAARRKDTKICSLFKSASKGT